MTSSKQLRFDCGVGVSGGEGVHVGEGEVAGAVAAELGLVLLVVLDDVVPSVEERGAALEQRKSLRVTISDLEKRLDL